MPQHANLQKTADSVRGRLTKLLDLSIYEPIPQYRLIEHDFQENMARRCDDAGIDGPLRDIALSRERPIAAVTYPKIQEIRVSPYAMQNGSLGRVLAKEFFRAWYAAHGAHAVELSGVGPDSLDVESFHSFSDVVLGGATFWKWIYARDAGEEEAFHRYTDGLRREALDNSRQSYDKAERAQKIASQIDTHVSHLFGFAAYHGIYRRDGVKGVKNAAHTCRTNSELWQRAFI